MKIVRDGLFFLALFGIFFTILNIKFSAKGKFLHVCKGSQVSRLDLVTLKEKFTLTKGTDVAWQVQSGDESENADERSSDILKNLVCSLPYVEKFVHEQPLSAEETAAFGFSQPRGQITFNEQTASPLIAGKDTPAGTEFYLLSAADPKTVYTIPNGFFVKLFPSFLELYPRLFFLSLDATSQQELKITFMDMTLHLVKDGKTWVDQSGRLNEVATQQLINTLQGFRYTNFRDEEDLAGEDLALYGFDFPDVVFEWRRQGASGPVKTVKMAVVNGQNYLTVEYNGETYLLILENKLPNLFMAYLQGLPLKETRTVP